MMNDVDFSSFVGTRKDSVIASRSATVVRWNPQTAALLCFSWRLQRSSGVSMKRSSCSTMALCKKLYWQSLASGEQCKMPFLAEHGRSEIWRVCWCTAKKLDQLTLQGAVFRLGSSRTRWRMLDLGYFSTKPFSSVLIGRFSAIARSMLGMVRTRTKSNGYQNVE